MTNYKKSLRGSGEAGKTTQQNTHSSKVSHAQGKCYHGYYTSQISSLMFAVIKQLDVQICILDV